ncbi:probable serine/threonine-protein kinase kinX [Papaver somniferum]|uniref:probable serine/threonine-protein kinase kinX n=1 Tax=Papaver somniferum TaxID=3469 RepID=UPI000E6FFD77|nr:probable serine/threonine-protein kinase kinX [Papaver somniferum]
MVTRKIRRTIKEEEIIKDDNTIPRSSKEESRSSKRKSTRIKSKKVVTPKSKKKAADSSSDDESQELQRQKGRTQSKKNKKAANQKKEKHGYKTNATKCDPEPAQVYWNQEEEWKDRNSKSEGGENSDEDNEDDAENEQVQDNEDDEDIEYMTPRVETEQTLEDMLQLLYAEQTHLVKPLTLPEDRYLPRAARWNIKEISVEFLKDMETSQNTFSEEFKEEYTLDEIEMLNKISQRLPVEDVPLKEDWQEKFEDLESYPPPQPNSEDEESSSSFEEDVHLSGNSDETIPSTTTPLVTEGEKEIPVDTQEKLNEQGNATPTTPVTGSSEENPTQYALEAEKDELQQTAATQVLGNIETEIGSLRERRVASLEEMLSNMQFMPLVCELPSLKELHNVPMEKFIDLAIHGKGIYTNEYSKYLQDEIMGDPYSSLGSLNLEYPSTGSLESLEKLYQTQIFDKYYAKDMDSPSQVSKPSFDLGLGPNDQNVENEEEVQQPAIDLGAPDPPQIHLAAAPAPNEASVGIEASNQAQMYPSAEQTQIKTAPILNEASTIDLAAPEQSHMNPATEKAEFQQPQQEEKRKPWDPIPFNEVERKKKIKNDRKQHPAEGESYKESESVVNLIVSHLFYYVYAILNGKEPGVSQTSAEDNVPLAKRLEDRLATKGNGAKPIEKKKASTSVKDKDKKKPTISANEKKDTPKITFTPQKPITRSNPQKRVDSDFTSGKDCWN